MSTMTNGYQTQSEMVDAVLASGFLDTAEIVRDPQEYIIIDWACFPGVERAVIRAFHAGLVFNNNPRGEMWATESRGLAVAIINRVLN